MARKKDQQPPAGAQPPPAPTGPPLWQDLPELCGHCGARVDQAEACRAPRPTCRFCSEPLPCTPIPQQDPNAINTGYTGPFAGLVNNAIAQSMQQANQFFAPGGLANTYAANQMMTGGMAYDPTAYLLQSGKPARATITNWTDMGIDMGTGRVCTVNIQVASEDGSTYPAESKTVIPTDICPRLSQGMNVGVRVDRSNPYTVHVVWSELAG